MRVVILGAALALSVGGVASAQGQHVVRGYTRADGTYVAPHMQTNPDGRRYNNWSSEGNVNPYNGQQGTQPLYPNTPPRSSYTPPANAWQPRQQQQNRPAFGPGSLFESDQDGN